jgi:predicted RNase H-like nuclease
VAGVDGSRGGWVVALFPSGVSGIRQGLLRLATSFEEVLSLDPAADVLAVDIPIGLSAERRPGGRGCDREARRLLGPRRSSVFSPPWRGALEARRYDQVRSEGLTIQCFNILPRIREVDRAMTAALQARVRESHPELAFLRLAGAPLGHPKRTPAGRRERLRALRRAPRGFVEAMGRVFRDGTGPLRRRDAAPDDLLDACVLAWTALRIARGGARRLPQEPEVDSRGLRMEIWW